MPAREEWEMLHPERTLAINTKERGAPLGDLFGIFFEDLNHAADGGLYGELVQNRSFEFDPIDNPAYHSMTAWEQVERGGAKAEFLIEAKNPVHDRNPHYLAINVLKPGEGAGIRNLGYNAGIPVRAGETYRFSCYARRDGDACAPVRVALESPEGTVYGGADLWVKTGGWQKYEAVLVPRATDSGSQLIITTNTEGRLYLDMVSLFPENTFKKRPNGLRQDLAQLLADLKPKFMRFPGGCLVHDGSLDPDARDSMYRWKNTLGDIAQRPARRSNWGYNQTLGLGYYEYFQFCEDIGAKPLPVLPAGYDPHHRRITPLDQLQPWIDDALDLIEFAVGGPSTVWGAKRAELGHPEPFGLEYLAIGNEEVGEPFFERYEYFHKAIRQKYPQIKLINSSGPFAAGGEYERGWKSARENGSDLVDEHYYQSPEWFLANVHRYDGFPAEGPKVFLGEYASWGNTWYNALVEAAYMTGLERNAHAVGLACYAPLLCNVGYVNWKPDLIWFDSHRAFGTANYYVQKLFMHHQGEHLLGVRTEGLEPTGAPGRAPITGGLSVQGDRIDARFYEITLKNTETGEEKQYPDACSGEASGTAVLGETDWTEYSLSLKAKRLNGSKGFFIHFGEKNQENRLRWEVGGWQNQDSMVFAFVDGRNSCLTQSLFTVETGREYHLELVVSGRKISTYIDGKLINQTEDKLPVIEPLYYSASVEGSTGDIIVKAVNVQEQPVQVKLVLEGLPQKALYGKVFQMAGYPTEAQNSFEEPERVSSTEKDICVSADGFQYEFPGQSFIVFRFHEAKDPENGGTGRE